MTYKDMEIEIKNMTDEQLDKWDTDLGKTGRKIMKDTPQHMKDTYRAYRDITHNEIVNRTNRDMKAK